MAAGLTWIYLFLILTAGMFVLIPLREIIRLLPFGLVGGFLVSMIMQTITVNLDLYRFNVALIELLGVPLGISLSWIPPVILFAYYFEKIRTTGGIILIVTFFVLFTTAVTYGSVLLGYRDYINWNIYSDIALAAIIHYGLALYLLYGDNTVWIRKR